MKQFSDEILLQVAKRGYQGRIVSIKHLSEIKEEIEGRHRKGLFDEEFYQERLERFDFRIPDNLPMSSSIIVVAVPRPQSQAVFTWNGKSQVLIIPPTYVAYNETDKRVEDLLAGILERRGYQVISSRLPLKLLAVRSGMASYGRNNICYVPGMGSFLQLVAVCSDLPCQNDSWQKAQMMRRCEDCIACRRACPTGAIASDRFLLHAERCIVFHNEKRGDVPFPQWMDPSWHNCLIGCFKCQKVCPENTGFLDWIEGSEVFSEEETTLLLKGATDDQMPVTTVKKLENLNLIEDLNIFPRNLNALLSQDARKRRKSDQT